MGDIKGQDNQLSKIARELGKRGGKKTQAIYGDDYFRELQKKSVAARLKNKKRG